MMRILLALLIILPMLVSAEGFDDPATDARYRALIGELRCLVCQNQSLADSHADLAKDMRHEVHKLVDQGQTNDQIVDYLVSRYGDFVRYRPPVNKTTWLLWFGPFILLAGGIAVLLMNIRRRNAVAKQQISNADRSRARSILENHPDDDHT